MKVLKYYISLAWRDVIRLWPATQLQVVIVAGICLPVLLLLGLKRGHVAELREELLKSPTGRQIIFWSGSEQGFLNREKIASLENEMAAVDLIIPESKRLLFFKQPNLSADDVNNQEQGVTFYATSKGDPLLSQFGVELSDTDDDKIIVSQNFMDKAKLAVGEKISLVAKRRIQGQNSRDE